MPEPIIGQDGSELRVVRLLANKACNLWAGYAVQDTTCDYYRTRHHLAHPAAWVRLPTSANRFPRRAPATALARQTAKGDPEGPTGADGEQLVFAKGGST